MKRTKKRTAKAVGPKRRSRFEMLEQRRMLSASSPASPADLGPVAHIDRVFVDSDGTDVWISVIGTDMDGTGGSADGVDIVTLRNHTSGSFDDIQAILEVTDLLYNLESDTFDVPTLEALAIGLGGTFLGIVVETGEGDDTIRATELKSHGNTLLDGGDGDDTFYSGAKNDTFLGGAGDDKVFDADRFDDLTDAGGAGDSDVVMTVPDDGSGFGITVVSDNIEDITGTVNDDKIDFSGNTDDVTIDGLAGDDSLEGGSGDDTILGGTGDDTIDGNGGDDDLKGGDGDDTIGGGDGDDVIMGEGGDDLLEGDDGDDTITGGTGEDTIFGGLDDDDLSGGDDDDFIDGGAGDDTVKGDAGDDTLEGGIGADTVEGGVGDDVLIGIKDGSPDTYDGGDGEDLLTFAADAMPILVNLETGDTDDGDTIVGAGLLDYVSPLGSLGSPDEPHMGAADSSIENVKGSDTDPNTLIGDSTPNTLVGGAAPDVIQGRDGNDVIVGEDSGDTLRGEGGDDIIEGNGGDDFIKGDGAFLDHDRLSGPAPYYYWTDGNDFIKGGDGDDLIWTNDMIDPPLTDPASLSGPAGPSGQGLGKDTVYGGDGDDTIFGDDGEDNVLGELGDDVIDAGGGDDSIHGGAGMDTLTGGLGADILVGGDDFDVLNIELINGAGVAGLLPDTAVVTGSGIDEIHVHGVTALPTTAEEASATIELDDDIGTPLTDVFSDYDPSIDGLFFMFP